MSNLALRQSEASYQASMRTIISFMPITCWSLFFFLSGPNPSGVLNQFQNLQFPLTPPNSSELRVVLLSASISRKARLVSTPGTRRRAWLCACWDSLSTA